ncbi:YciI family protein [Filomicrobium sp.]|uniref:YciI family protein n=1 Tax=Filomicrobium sp. TaxID=2024831 RepID=UPI0025909A8F|nr:YciI family protein [Filomicrobium sp.]MCV0370806.1 YciI family protein [Filomicrobium sp.]
MKFLSMVKSAEHQGPPPMALMEAVGGLVEEATKAGIVINVGGLMPSQMGARVRLSNGKLSVTDGPFAEAREVIGGCAMFELKSKEEAIDWAKRLLALHLEHWPEREGECEIRQIASE